MVWKVLVDHAYFIGWMIKTFYMGMVQVYKLGMFLNEYLNVIIFVKRIVTQTICPAIALSPFFVHKNVSFCQPHSYGVSWHIVLEFHQFQYFQMLCYFKTIFVLVLLVLALLSNIHKATLRTSS